MASFLISYIGVIDIGRRYSDILARLIYVSMSVSVWMAIETDSHGIMKCKRLSGDEHDGFIKWPLSLMHSGLLSNMIVAKQVRVRALLADWRCGAVMIRAGEDGACPLGWVGSAGSLTKTEIVSPADRMQMCCR